MKKKVLRMISMILVIVMLAGLVTGCGGSGSGNESNSDAVTVSLLVPYDFEDELKTVVEVFEKSHSDIKVDLVLSSGDGGQTPTELSKLAAGSNLPDVAVGVENFAYILSQGLAYPLDNLYAADGDEDNALQAGIDNYTYDGHLYALPYRVQFNGMLINTDLLETKNLDTPDYDWTIEEFISLAKAATDSQYSGINIVVGDDDTHALQTKLMGAMMDEPYQMYGYNMETHEFDFTSGAWTKAQEYIKELRSVPGLVSDELKEWDKRNNGIADAYDNKFGGSADALASGKVLFGNHNTWETYWMADKFNFEWDIYPVPHAEDVSERIQTHIDYVFMTPAVTEEKAEAAYELVKFLSYSEEGCLARMEYSAENASTSALYTPASSDPEVLKAYNDSDIIPEGMKYMLNTVSENPEKIFIADANKLIPNFWNDVNEYLEQTEEQIENGGDAHALAQDLQNKVNTAAKDTWANFETKLKTNLEQFYKDHAYEQK
ncbi:MAG: carbohydrate ABC transporter substrate-binding protein [Tyzzerella sp.]|nr:carbohydrate ABC transporter substrate-binding protein [Tyzzerella sp.]